MGFATFVTGRGLVDSDELAVERAVNEYDERLYFKRNDQTGQYCVYLKTIPSEPDVPLYGFDQIPEPGHVVRKLYESDSLRHGEQILEQMDRRQREAQQPYIDAAEDAKWQAAEALEWGFRKMGAHPTARIFVPGDE